MARAAALPLPFLFVDVTAKLTSIRVRTNTDAEKCYSTLRMLNYNCLKERWRCEINSYFAAHLDEQLFPQATQVGFQCWLLTA
jgi:hypothetical protein